MILTCHLLTGAAIVSRIQPTPLAFLLSILSHFFLDFLPHWDYSPKNKQKKKDFPSFLKGTLDLSFGSLLILILSGGQPIILIGAFLSILPDAISFFNMLFPSKILKGYDNFHLEKVHFLKNHVKPSRNGGRGKKIPLFWEIFSELSVGSLAIFLLLT